LRSIDDRQYVLADLVYAVGMRFGYLYDLGDSWRHDIVVESILGEELSNGACNVLEGARVFSFKMSI
jgi:hypothetical protein